MQEASISLQRTSTVVSVAAPLAACESSMHRNRLSPRRSSVGVVNNPSRPSSPSCQRSVLRAMQASRDLRAMPDVRRAGGAARRRNVVLGTVGPDRRRPFPRNSRWSFSSRSPATPTRSEGAQLSRGGRLAFHQPCTCRAERSGRPDPRRDRVSAIVSHPARAVASALTGVAEVRFRYGTMHDLDVLEDLLVPLVQS